MMFLLIVISKCASITRYVISQLRINNLPTLLTFYPVSCEWCILLLRIHRWAQQRRLHFCGLWNLRLASCEELRRALRSFEDWKNARKSRLHEPDFHCAAQNLCFKAYRAPAYCHSSRNENEQIRRTATRRSPQHGLKRWNLIVWCCHPFNPGKFSAKSNVSGAICFHFKQRYYPDLPDVAHIMCRLA